MPTASARRPPSGASAMALIGCVAIDAVGIVDTLDPAQPHSKMMNTQANALIDVVISCLRATAGSDSAETVANMQKKYHTNARRIGSMSHF
jgi:hypothetical protein